MLWISVNSVELGHYYTVKVMIMSRYRYRPVTVFGPTLPTVTVFEPKLLNVTQRDINVTDRYWPLPIEFYRYLRYKRYKRYRS